MNKKQLLAVFALMLALLGILGGIHMSGITGNTEKNHLEIKAFSVGKADALLIREGDQVVLIDAGEKDDGGEIVKELKESREAKRS